MAIHLVFSLHLLISCLVGPVLGGVRLSTLPRTLEVQASTEPGAMLQAGEDKITVTWGLNQTYPETTDETYTMVKVKLCFAPISQYDRPWRKAKDDISKDNSCKLEIVCRPYSKDHKMESYDWLIGKDVSTATYFIRAYAFDATDKEVAYGQTADDRATMNLFKVEGISGRLASFNVLAGCFSILTVVSLCGFLMFEQKRLARRG